MKKTKSDIFIIPVANKYLVYSPLNGISAMINFSGVMELKRLLNMAKGSFPETESKLSELANHIINAPVLPLNKKTGNLDPEFLGIIPTRTCNGACNYCDFNAGQSSSKKMSFRMAVNIVDWYARKMQDLNRNEIDIHFFGGEPMMASDVIEVAVHRTRLNATERGMVPFFQISTNGQYDEKKANFLGNYFNKVVLSIDGHEEIQNYHRPLNNGEGSFKNALRTARIISNSQAELYLRACISKVNVNLMEQITRWFCESLNPSMINFEVLCPTSQTEKKNLFPPGPYEFAKNFIRARNAGQEYGIKVVFASDLGSVPTVSSCPVGKDTAIFTPDGRINSCYLNPERWQSVGLDLCIGKIDKFGTVVINDYSVKQIRMMVEDKPRCDACFCQWNCAGGCHVGLTFPGCDENYDDFCIQTRIISACSLLSDLGLHKEAELLINDDACLTNLANNKSDLLTDIS